MKKNRFRRLLSALLTAALLLSMLPVFGWAEDASAPTMQIIVPEAESILIGNYDLRVEWAPVVGAAYYLFTAKNLTTDEYITEREDLGPLCEYEILAMYLPYDSSFRFWVGAFDASGVQLAGSDVEYVVYTSSEAEAEAYFQQISSAAPEVVDEPAVDASNESAPTHSEPVAPEIVDEPAVDASNESSPNHSETPAPEVVDEPAVEVPAETAIPEPALKPADPIVSIVIDGTAMAAQWAAVEGAERYVYSLRCLTDDRLLANHEPTDGCSVSRNLAPGKQYKIAVAAVPFGVSDTIADAARCGWGEATFSIAASTETTADASSEPILPEPTADASNESILPEPTADASSEPVLPETTPTHSEPAAPEVDDAAHAESVAKVLSVATDMSSNTVGFGERVTVTIVCNPATAALDVYDLNYLTLTSHAVNEQGNPTFEYTAEYADEGAHSLRFVALNARNEWSSESADQGFAQIMVCSHSATTVLIDASAPTNYSELQHQVTYTYRKSCLCGQVFEEYAEVALAAHEERSETLSYELTHTPELGHRKFYKCSCGASFIGRRIPHAEGLLCLRRSPWQEQPLFRLPRGIRKAPADHGSPDDAEPAGLQRRPRRRTVGRKDPDGDEPVPIRGDGTGGAGFL